jgi:hypothetical protein
MIELDFTCDTEQGALLACTRSADFEGLSDIVSLKEFLLQKAGAVYIHASNIRRLDKEESLYIITGCIKNDGWSLAAFRDARPGDLLKLARRHNQRDHGTAEGRIYDWEVRGPAQARLWPNTPDEVGSHGKNQSLFLQGFKLAFSARFRARMDGLKRTLPVADSSSDQRRGDDVKDASERPLDQSESSGDTGSGWHAPNSSSTGATHFSFSNDVQIQAFPSAVYARLPCVFPMSRRSNRTQQQTAFSFHPCDMITKLLLEMVGLLIHAFARKLLISYLLIPRPDWCRLRSIARL